MFIKFLCFQGHVQMHKVCDCSAFIFIHLTDDHKCNVIKIEQILLLHLFIPAIYLIINCMEPVFVELLCESNSKVCAKVIQRLCLLCQMETPFHHSTF